MFKVDNKKKTQKKETLTIKTLELPQGRTIYLYYIAYCLFIEFI